APCTPTCTACRRSRADSIEPGIGGGRHAARCASRGCGVRFSVCWRLPNAKARRMTASLEHPDHLRRSLSNRHLQLIAIGGAIGTGLFMGSGKTISLAGPSILLVYLIIGVMLFFV